MGSGDAAEEKRDTGKQPFCEQLVPLHFPVCRGLFRDMAISKL